MPFFLPADSSNGSFLFFKRKTRVGLLVWSDGFHSNALFSRLLFRSAERVTFSIDAKLYFKRKAKNLFKTFNV